jgi:uncharacterized membrane protein
MAVRVLYCGDTQAETLITAKGMDTFILNSYRDSARVLREALSPRPGIKLTHMPADKVRAEFPMTPEEFANWDVIILSDVGYNNISLLPGNRERIVPMGPDRVGNFRKWVEGGGGLIMAGGYTTFSGIEGKGIWGGTPIEAVLPVTCDRGNDDRIEVPDGATLDVLSPEHPILKGVSFDKERIILGYNRVFPKTESEIVMRVRGDVFLAVAEFGKGRSVAYTTDPVYHWCGNLHEWANYGLLWERMAKWAAREI